MALRSRWVHLFFVQERGPLVGRVISSRVRVVPSEARIATAWAHHQFDALGLHLRWWVRDGSRLGLGDDGG